MSDALTQARQLASQRAEQAATERADALAHAREMAVAVATDTKPPTPAAIIELCDSLGADINWFTDAVERCQRRMADVAGLARIPGLESQASDLEARHATLIEQHEAAEKKYQLQIGRMKNRAQTFTDFFDESTTEEQFAELAKLKNEATLLSNGAWLARRDARLLRSEIAELSKIDLDNIDPKSTMPAPHDFALPEVR